MSENLAPFIQIQVAFDCTQWNEGNPLYAKRFSTLIQVQPLRCKRIAFLEYGYRETCFHVRRQKILQLASVQMGRVGVKGDVEFFESLEVIGNIEASAVDHGNKYFHVYNFRKKRGKDFEDG
ncbi:hypothetical protein GALMADRAFT_235689 [Galerina marginata CBS 339.88]|uniref:Uncharacterized protein n=1 Tax=Galerina marginata (strain CBS 339.88) TaxID=685588 RepID=A0A067TJX6_GALM3|nr:hypothetical protein GALMADRAFT_235689 [Galerina marginata CBS 339.88]